MESIDGVVNFIFENVCIYTHVYPFSRGQQLCLRLQLERKGSRRSSQYIVSSSRETQLFLDCTGLLYILPLLGSNMSEALQTLVDHCSCLVPMLALCCRTHSESLGAMG